MNCLEMAPAMIQKGTGNFVLATRFYDLCRSRKTATALSLANSSCFTIFAIRQPFCTRVSALPSTCEVFQHMWPMCHFSHLLIKTMECTLTNTNCYDFTACES